MWLVRRAQPTMLQRISGGKGYIIDVSRFHSALHQTFADYLRQIVDPASEDVRKNLWKKMDHISQIRGARGLIDQSDGGAGSDQNAT